MVYKASIIFSIIMLLFGIVGHAYNYGKRFYHYEVSIHLVNPNNNCRFIAKRLFWESQHDERLKHQLQIYLYSLTSIHYESKPEYIYGFHDMPIEYVEIKKKDQKNKVHSTISNGLSGSTIYDWNKNNKIIKNFMELKVNEKDQ